MQRRSGAALRAALALIAAGGIAAESTAAEPVRVVIVSSGAGDPIAGRLIDELVAAGVTVEVTGAQVESLAALGRSEGARAVIRVDASRRAVRVWLAASPDADPETVSEGQGGDADVAARSLALRVVEALRPYLEQAPAPVPAASGPPPTVRSAAAAATVSPASSPAPSTTAAPAPQILPPSARPAPWPDGLSIYVAPAVLLQPATALTPGAAVLWGFTKVLRPYGGIDVCALVPVLPAVLTGPTGTVKVATGAIGAGASLRYPTVPSRLTGWIGLGLAAGFVGYDAEASSSDVSASDGVVAHALPYARAAAEWRASPWLGVRADLLTAIARPRPVLAVAELPDTALEEPLVAVSLGALVWLP